MSKEVGFGSEAEMRLFRGKLYSSAISASSAGILTLRGAQLSSTYPVEPLEALKQVEIGYCRYVVDALMMCSSLLQYHVVVHML